MNKIIDIMPLFGENIRISENLKEYTKLRNLFESFSFKAKNTFIEYYKKDNKSIEDVSKNALIQGEKALSEIVKIIMQMFIELEIYNVDETLFFNQFSYYYEAYYKVNDKYMDIVLTEKQKDEYRTFRRQHRGRWQGGGFGVKGALKGAATAGMLNMATGAAHGVFNLSGKLVSSIGATVKKNELFNNPSTLEILLNGIDNCCKAMLLVFIDCFNRNSSYNIVPISIEYKKEADVLFHNIQSNYIVKNEKIKLLTKIIELYPFNKEIYLYILNEYGDSNCEVENIANYFGYDIVEDKNKIIKKYYEKLDISTEEIAKQSRKKLYNKIVNLGLKPSQNDYLKFINEKLEEFDLKARTFLDIVLSSKEEVELAKKELEDIMLGQFNEELLISKKEKLPSLNLNSEVKKIILRFIDDYLLKINKSKKKCSYSLYKQGVVQESDRQELYNNFISIIENLRKQKYNDTKKLQRFINSIDKYNIKELYNAKQKILSSNTNLDKKLIDEAINAINACLKDKIGVIVMAIILIILYMS